MLAFETDATSRMKAVHSLLHFLVRLHPDVEVENDLCKPRGLDFLQYIHDALRIAEQYRIFGELLGLDLLQPFHHLDKIGVSSVVHSWDPAGSAGITHSL